MSKTNITKPVTSASSNPTQGSIIVSILLVMVFLVGFILNLMILANSNLVRARTRILLLQAQYTAESGVDAAIANLNNIDTNYTGTGVSETEVLANPQYRATFSTTVVVGSTAKERIITSIGKVYAPAGASSARYVRKIEVVAQRSSATSAASIISRNILEVESGVKNIQGRDVYVNGYINMNKNTTNLIAENVTVGDKNTGASNCSIGGTGNLLKPTSFTTPGQTKTRLNLAYNNCINPPGNNSNANFDVFANQSNIPKIQSTLIPWSQFMDASYQSSPGGCSDWTSGASPRDIPSTGNTKRTHYPDSGNNISSSCGTSGDLSLGSVQYNIRDHVHLRANLCAASACTPTFNNPNATIKFIFIEGTINFDNLITTPGSGPMVFITYGTDPASKASVCPLGGSIYIGKSGNASAPAIFLLATHGLCLDKTKFGSSPALGGVSGKNLFISSSPGTPFDLKLDPTFPVDQIPIDLAWRAVRYRRL